MVTRYLVIDLRSVVYSLLYKMRDEQDKEWRGEAKYRSYNSSLVNPLVKAVDMITRIIEYMFKLINWLGSIYEIEKMILVDEGPKDEVYWCYYDRNDKRWGSSRVEKVKLIESVKSMRKYKYTIDEEVMKKQFKFQCKKNGINSEVRLYNFNCDERRWKEYANFIYYTVVNQIQIGKTAYVLSYEYLLFSLVRIKKYPIIHARVIESLDGGIVVSSRKYFQETLFSNSINVNPCDSSIEIEQEGEFRFEDRVFKVEKKISRDERARSIRRVIERAYGPILDINDDMIIMRLSSAIEMELNTYIPREIYESDYESYYPRMLEKLIRVLETYEIYYNEWIPRD